MEEEWPSSFCWMRHVFEYALETAGVIAIALLVGWLMFFLPAIGILFIDSDRGRWLSAAGLAVDLIWMGYVARRTQQPVCTVLAAHAVCLFLALVLPAGFMFVYWVVMGSIPNYTLVLALVYGPIVLSGAMAGYRVDRREAAAASFVVAQTSSTMLTHTRTLRTEE